MWYPNTIGIPQINRMKKIELHKRLEACKKVKRSLLTSYMDGYYQTMLMDARIASITREMNELLEPKKLKLRGKVIGPVGNAEIDPKADS